MGKEAAFSSNPSIGHYGTRLLASEDSITFPRLLESGQNGCSTCRFFRDIALTMDKPEKSQSTDGNELLIWVDVAWTKGFRPATTRIASISIVIHGWCWSYYPDEPGGPRNKIISMKMLAVESDDGEHSKI